jgi:hypothetical protein
MRSGVVGTTIKQQRRSLFIHSGQQKDAGSPSPEHQRWWPPYNTGPPESHAVGKKIKTIRIWLLPFI